MGGRCLADLITPGVYDEVRQAITEQMEGALRELGVEPQSLEAVKLHHLCFKSAFHNGRGGITSAISLRPFLQQAVFAISMSEKNPFKDSGRAGAGICHDLIIMINPELAAHRYDATEKNITLEYAINRFNELGGCTEGFTSPVEYTVYGEIASLSNAPPSCFMQMVSEYSFDDEDIRTVLVDRVTKFWEGVQDRELRRVFKHLFREACENLESSKPIASAGVYAARLLSFELVDASELIGA